MNGTDRRVLIHVIRALKTINTPANPADIAGHVKGLKRAKEIARHSASLIEDLGYGDLDLARESADHLETLANER